MFTQDYAGDEGFVASAGLRSIRAVKMGIDPNGKFLKYSSPHKTDTDGNVIPLAASDTDATLITGIIVRPQVSRAVPDMNEIQDSLTDGEVLVPVDQTQGIPVMDNAVYFDPTTATWNTQAGIKLIGITWANNGVDGKNIGKIRVRL